MHPRNRHGGRYDIPALAQGVPELAGFVRTNPRGEPTIDFADPAAVKTLNRALLKAYYGVGAWDIPPGYLCPPVPGRADYVHYAADLLGGGNGKGRRDETLRVLDVGTGANLIYPIIGRAEYGWSFVGSDVDPAALANARRLVEANPALAGAVELRLQTAPDILRGLILPDERFELLLCNPPFHSSPDEAAAVNRRKWEKLKRPASGAKNFGGQGGELWTPGGEAAFARRLISESAAFGGQVRWFTILISRSEHLPELVKALARVKPSASRAVEMSQGQR